MTAALVSLLAIYVTLSLTVGGWLVARVVALNTLVDTKQETIEELRRQVSELTITAVLTDRLAAALPPAPREATR